MSLLLMAFVAAVVLSLLAVGMVVGWLLSGDRTQLDLLARRLEAEQRIELATRATLQAMRQAVRRHQ